jgi:hypothetical protein
MAKPVDHLRNLTQAHFSGAYEARNCGASSVKKRVAEKRQPIEIQQPDVLAAQFECYKLGIASVGVVYGEASSVF